MTLNKNRHDCIGSRALTAPIASLIVLTYSYQEPGKTLTSRLTWALPLTALLFIVVWSFPYSIDNRSAWALFPIAQWLGGANRCHASSYQPGLVICIIQVLFYVWPILWAKRPYLRARITLWVAHVLLLNGSIYFVIFNGVTWLR